MENKNYQNLRFLLHDAEVAEKDVTVIATSLLADAARTTVT